MTRSTARELAMRLIYTLGENPENPEELISRIFEREYYASLTEEDEAYDSRPGGKQLEYITRVVRGVYEHAAELDGYIDKYSVGWRFGRIPRTAIAILKTAMFEVLYMQEIPDGAAINEAVELSKKYEAPETIPFINGLLGSFIRAETGAPPLKRESCDTPADDTGNTDGQ